MPKPLPKGLWPAVTNVQLVAVTRKRLYRHYDRDKALHEALVRFQSKWWNELSRQLRRLDDCLPDLDDAEERLADLVGVEAARDYLGDLTALCADAGLDRISMVGTPPVVLVGYLPGGIAQVHRYLWHLDKALLWERSPLGDELSGSAVHRPTFVSLDSNYGTPIPALNTSIAGTEASWNPREEPLAKARRRLRESTGRDPEAIEAELARIVEESGYYFPDTTTQHRGIYRLDRDAQWTWWRIRRRWTYEEIAETWMRLHPGDTRLQPRKDDPTARKWDAEHPGEEGILTAPPGAIAQVRKAVSTFAGRAHVDVKTRPARQPSTSAGKTGVGSHSRTDRRD